MCVTPYIPCWRRACAAALLLFTFAVAQAADSPGRKTFDVPAGAAPTTLKQFSAQAGGHLLYSADAVTGVTTNAVKGEFVPHAALDQMLEGTRLVSRIDAATGALSVTRRAATPVSNEVRGPAAGAHEGGGNGADSGNQAPGKDVVELSPFTVNSDRDRGFVAASALAGGRLSTDLKDTPVAYSVLTRDFIDALNLTTLTSAQQWTTGFNEIEDDGRQNQFGDGERGRRTFRGVSSNQQQIEFFPAYYDYDSYNLERFDFARGPNSILFGSGSMGGTANGLFKRAQTNKATGEVSLGLSSWHSFRSTVDLNKPLTPKLAVRFNGLWEDANTWRDVEYYNRRAMTLATTYRPWRGGTFRATAEIGENHRNASLTGMGDRVSGWDGVTVFTGRQATAPANANALGVGFFGVNNFIFSPGIMGSAIVDWAGHANTQGGNASAAVPIGGAFVVGPLANYQDAPLLGATNRPDNAFQNVLRGAPKFFVPPRTASTTLGGDTWMTQFDNIHLAFDQQLGRHIFLGLSGNYSYSIVRTHFTVARGLNNVYIDVNRLLPTGEANPYFLTPYSESTHDFDHVKRRSRNGRANIAAVFDDTRFGSFRFNLEAGVSDANFSRIKFRFGLQDPNIPSRDWINELARVRYYWGGPLDLPGPGMYDVVTPATGLTRRIPAGYAIDVGRPNDTNSIEDVFGYAQAALGAKFFKGRLNLLGAIRRDDYESITNHMVLRGDQPNGWDGVKVNFRPRAPADYFSLTYVPKNAAGQPTGPATEALARPRTANVGQPQYANDRFRDDYSLPTIKGKVDTYSIAEGFERIGRAGRPFVVRNCRIVDVPHDAFRGRVEQADETIFGWGGDLGKSSELRVTAAIGEWRQGRLAANVIDAPIPKSFATEEVDPALAPYGIAASTLMLVLSNELTYTPFHHDAPAEGGGWMWLAEGEKLWTLVDLETTDALLDPATKTLRDIPTDELICREEYACWGRVRQAWVESGDFLYFPIGWAHRVKTYQRCLGLGGYALLPTDQERMERLVVPWYEARGLNLAHGIWRGERDKA